VLIGALAPLIYTLNAGREWTGETAPVSRTAPDRWTSGNKDAIGTAHSTASPVWFTAVHGTLADLLYPTVDRNNLRQFGFLVTDGSSFFFDASQQGVASSRVTDERALIYELRVDDPAHHFSLVTTIAAESDSPVVFVRTHLAGDSSHLHVYA
jgi:glucoamylase